MNFVDNLNENIATSVRSNFFTAAAGGVRLFLAASSSDSLYNNKSRLQLKMSSHMSMFQLMRISKQC